MKLKEAILEALRCISDATDGGRKIVIGSGEALEASGILDVIGLEIVIPTKSKCTRASGTSGGSPIDYAVIAKGLGGIIATCEAVRHVPCAPHSGIRITRHANPKRS